MWCLELFTPALGTFADVHGTSVLAFMKLLTLDGALYGIFVTDFYFQSDGIQVILKI